MTEPDIIHTRGYTPITGGAMIRLWGRDHATYDIARTKGPARSTHEVSSHTFIRSDGRAEIYAHRRDNRHNEEPMPVLHGDVFDTADEADRARYDAGWLVFEETVRQFDPAPYSQPWGHRDPDDPGGDVSDFATEAAARDMVYGTGR